ncbi:hypothetical protein AB0L85_13585 [Streptomyces sp. NPDC052051]|uniref:hypothetical protein n=1 Tax=Streptomyces sp. NPDC052051 TaxID=3154649 RepID=UPI003445D567
MPPAEAPEAPALSEAAPDAPAPLAETPEPPTPQRRRRLRGVLRWTAAVLVFAVAGASSAYGVARMERAELPGLSTLSDGRWEYPRIVHPPLPAGRPGPSDDDNLALVHYADLRKLVLPAPKGAKADPKFADHGWVKPETYIAEYELEDDRDLLKSMLVDRGLRHIAGRAWTMPDGTRTRIYLLQFETGLVVSEVQENHFSGYATPTRPLRGALASDTDASFPEAVSDGILMNAYVEAKPYGAEQVRHAYLTSGDVIALVVQSRKGGAEQIPFQQTVALQRQLLD